MSAIGYEDCGLAGRHHHHITTPDVAAITITITTITTPLPPPTPRQAIAIVQKRFRGAHPAPEHIDTSSGQWHGCDCLPAGKEQANTSPALPGCSSLLLLLLLLLALLLSATFEL
jgi:hypothetical protein